MPSLTKVNTEAIENLLTELIINEGVDPIEYTKKYNAKHKSAIVAKYENGRLALREGPRGFMIDYVKELKEGN